MFQFVIDYKIIRYYKTKLGRALNCNYRQENIHAVIKDVRLGRLSGRKSCEKYGILRKTLKRKMESTHTLKYDRQPVFTENEEQDMVQSLVLCGQWGFLLTKFDIRCILTVLVYKNHDSRIKCQERSS